MVNPRQDAAEQEPVDNGCPFSGHYLSLPDPFWRNRNCMYRDANHVHSGVIEKGRIRGTKLALYSGRQTPRPRKTCYISRYRSHRWFSRATPRHERTDLRLRWIVTADHARWLYLRRMDRFPIPNLTPRPRFL